MNNKKFNRVEHNKKVATKRSKKWKSSLTSGRYDAILHPTKLRLQRLVTGIDQSGLAKSIGMKTSSYGAVERAKRNVNKKRAELISKKLNKDINAMFKQVRENFFVAIH